MASSTPTVRALRPVPREVHKALIWQLCALSGALCRGGELAWGILVQSCVGRQSLESVARQFDGRSATWLRGILTRLLGAWSAAAWEDRFNRALLALALPRLRGQRVTLVGDETHLPFYGEKRGELKLELRGGPPKNGAVRFFAYVTICALWRDRRVVLAVGRWRGGESLAEVVERLGRPLLEAGLNVKAWLWDRGGATVAMLSWWQAEGQPFVVAAPRKGQKAGVAARLTELEAEWGWQRRRPAAVTEAYTLHPAKGSGLAPVTVRLVVGWEPVKKARKKRRQRGLRRAAARPGQVWRAVAWFTDGGDWRGRGGAVQEAYRKRQSIESSYRMSHASRGRTTSRDARYRFLLFAVSQFLQAVWVWLEEQVTRRGARRPLRRRVCLADLVRAMAAAGAALLAAWLARLGPHGTILTLAELEGAGV